MWNKSIRGGLGEDIAAAFLIQKGFVIDARNYKKKIGEIDIIAHIKDITYFLEVKLVTYENYNNFSRETLEYRPEDRVNREKILKIARVGEIYLSEVGRTESECSIGVVAIILNPKTMKAHCRYIEHVL